MLYNEICATAEMPVWTGEESAPNPTWGVYTSLGAFVPRRSPKFTPHARRVEHEAKHQVELRAGQVRKWTVNAWREAGEFLFGAFQPIRDAI